MAKNKMSIKFDGYKELKAKLDSIGGESTKRAVEGALKASQQLIARQANEAMLSHDLSLSFSPLLSGNTFKNQNQIVSHT